MNVGIIGSGSIATHLNGRLELLGIKTSYMLKSNEQFKSVEYLDQHNPRAVFLTISTKDHGEAARAYMLECVERGVPVITCEKGALAYHAKDLKKYIELIRFSAAVGGGTKLLPYIKGRLITGYPTRIQAVLNGTLNYIFHEMQQSGRALGEACDEAQKLGYAEPGANTIAALLNGELKDIQRKVCVLFNMVLATNTYLTPDMLEPFEFSNLEIQASNAGSRLVVEFSNTNSGSKILEGPSFNTHVGNWTVSAGLRTIDTSLSWLPGGIGNAIHITEGELGKGGIYTLIGPGAGSEATTSALISDLLNMV